MQALLQQYKDQTTSLKYRISCLQLQNSTLQLQMKELQTRANQQLDKKDKIINDQDQKLHRLSLATDSDVKKLQKDRLQAVRSCQMLQEEIVKVRGQAKRLQTEILQQLCSALGVKQTPQHTIPFLLTKIRQVKQQHDSLLFENQKQQEKLEQKQTGQQTEDKKLLNQRIKELEDEVDLLKLNQQHNEQKYYQQLTQLEREGKTVKGGWQKLQSENDRLKQQLKRQKQQYLAEIDEFQAKFEQLELEKNELRQHIEGMGTENRNMELEHEFGQLLDRIRVKKESRIKSLLSEKYWRLDTNARSIGSRDVSMMTHQY